MARMLFGPAELEVPPTVLAAPAEQASADDFLLAPLPQTPPASDQEAAEVGELRKDVESFSQQLAAALAILNTLSVSDGVVSLSRASDGAYTPNLTYCRGIPSRA